MSRGAVYQYRGGLAKLVRHLAALANRPDLPAQVPRVAMPSPRKVIAGPGEVLLLLAAAKPWLRCAILLAAHTALRRSDILRVAPAHYDAETRTITLDQKKTGNSVTIPVTETLAVSLENAPPDPNPLTPFLERYAGRKLTGSAVNKAWLSVRKRTGVNPHLNFHDLRRTVAVSLYEISKDLRIVEQMLGHKSLGSTVRYLEHRDPAKLRPYLDAIFVPKGRIQ